MNAVCGHWRRRGGGPGATPEAALEAMLAAMPPAGAAGNAVWTSGAAGLGCRVATEEDREDTRPHFDTAAGLAVVADARLDERDALCDALGVPHPERVRLPDRALILLAWRRWGRECPAHLLGDYAFAIWDERSRTLFCARDHIGVRPFYYALSPDRFAFASAVDGVLAAPGVSDALDEAAVATRLMRGGQFPVTRTLFRDVRKLPAGHWLAVEDGGTATLERWWRPEEAPAVRCATDDACAEAFLDLYRRAVRDRLRSVHPVGVHLSGGLDSSSIAVLAARELRRRGWPAPLAFSWLPPPRPGPLGEQAAAEYGRIDAVAVQEGLRVVHRAPEAADVVAYLREDGARGHEFTLLNEAVIQRAASEHGVRVLLSGWGGDEGISFNGQGYYPHLLRSGQIGRLWREARERGHPLRFILRDAAAPLVVPDWRWWRATLRRKRRHGRLFRPTLVHPAFARRTRPLPRRTVRTVGVRSTQLQLLNHGHLSARMEGWAASGARYGLDYRYPLLDRRVLEFALGLPPEQFRRGRETRWLMRHALRAVLPLAVRRNPDKRDPSRYDAVRDAVAEALPVLRRDLETRPDPPSRARYVDLPRLLDRLDATACRTEGYPIGSVLGALQLLD